MKIHCHTNIIFVLNYYSIKIYVVFESRAHYIILSDCNHQHVFVLNIKFHSGHSLVQVSKLVNVFNVKEKEGTLSALVDLLHRAKLITSNKLTYT